MPTPTRDPSPDAPRAHVIPVRQGRFHLWPMDADFHLHLLIRQDDETGEWLVSIQTPPGKADRQPL